MDVILAILLALQSAVAAPPTSGLPPRCDKQVMQRRTGEDAISHRRFEPPVIQYPFGTQVGRDWGFPVTFGIDETGRITCFSTENFVRLGGAPPYDTKLTPMRLTKIAELTARGYEPFRLQNGKAVEVEVSEDIAEEELPQAASAPAGPVKTASLRFSRDGVYENSWAGYSLSIDLNGHVKYEGGRRADVKGVHEYDIPAKQVAELIEEFGKRGLWGTRSGYRNPDFDHQTFVLEIEVNGRTHRIVDVLGRDVGMPKAVTDFEHAVDRVGRSDMWNPLSLDGLRLLEKEGFDFRSEAAVEMFARMYEGGFGEEAVPLRMLELGLPPTASWQWGQEHFTAIEAATGVGLERLVQSLLDRGALLKDGKVDQALASRAFIRALRSGRVGVVRAIWNATTTDTRPDLFAFGGPAERISSLAYLNGEKKYEEHPLEWQGYEIVEWAEGIGADLHFRTRQGRGLLAIASKANDARLVRFLLSRGLDPAVEDPDSYEDSLSSTESEEVALLLLDAGAKHPNKKEEPALFRAIAEEYGWDRVIAWLDAHPEW